jgi:paraquat-inducible protein B
MKKRSKRNEGVSVWVMVVVALVITALIYIYGNQGGGENIGCGFLGSCL